MLIAIGLFLSGVVFTAIAVRMLFKRRILIASVNGTAGFSLLSVSITLTLILLNIHTYHQLTAENKLAVIEIGVLTDYGLPLRIHTDKIKKTYYINAEEWQLDARFLKWKSWAYLLGAEPVVRLESLSERRPLRNKTVPEKYNLLGEHALLTDWGSTLSDWFGMVDTYYGSAVYMPAVQGSTYTVSATISGLIVRADNKQAHEAVTGWPGR